MDHERIRRRIDKITEVIDVLTPDRETQNISSPECMAVLCTLLAAAFLDVDPRKRDDLMSDYFERIEDAVGRAEDIREDGGEMFDLLQVHVNDGDFHESWFAVLDGRHAYAQNALVPAREELIRELGDKILGEYPRKFMAERAATGALTALIVTDMIPREAESTTALEQSRSLSSLRATARFLGELRSRDLLYTRIIDISLADWNEMVKAAGTVWEMTRASKGAL